MSVLSHNNTKVLLFCLQKCARKSTESPGMGKFRYWKCQPSDQNGEERENSCSPPLGSTASKCSFAKRREPSTKGKSESTRTWRMTEMGISIFLCAFLGLREGDACFNLPQRTKSWQS